MKLRYGVVQEAHPPGTPQNKNKFQYEYGVLLTGDNFTQIPLLHVLRSDEFGAADDFNDSVLQPGQKVLVMCLTDYSDPIIVGAIRNTRRLMPSDEGVFTRRRFNKIEQLIDKSFNYQVKSDSGPNLNVKTDSIILDDSTGERIVLDKANKVMILEANKWTVTIKGDATIDITGNASVKAAKLDAEIKGDANVKAGNAKVESSGKVEVEASGKVALKGSVVEVNGGGGNIITTATQPTCYVTGIPFQGTGKAKAG